MQVPLLNGLCVSAASHARGHTGTGHWLPILYLTLPRPLSHQGPLHPPRNDFPFVSFTVGPAKPTYVSVTSQGLQAQPLPLLPCLSSPIHSACLELSSVIVAFDPG